jgi:putative sigma-54 modulation protein
LDIRVIGKHIEMTDAVKARIEDKVSGLPRFYNSILDVEVIVEGSKDGASSSVEIIARARHNRVFIGKQTDPDMYACVDEAVKKVERQLTKQKQKERDNKHTGSEP